MDNERRGECGKGYVKKEKVFGIGDYVVYDV